MNRPHPGSLTRGIRGSSQFLEGMAETLQRAYANGPIASIAPSIPYPNIGVAYSIQETNARHWMAGGRTLAGRKIAKLDPEVEVHGVGIETVAGLVFADMLCEAGARLALSSFLQPRISPAAAFQLSCDILDRPETAPRNIEWACPALEVLDSRVQGWGMSDMDLAADNASMGAIVMGARCAWPRGGEKVLGTVSSYSDEGTLSHDIALPDIDSALEDLARKMIARGRPLLAGEIVIVGALDGIGVTGDHRHWQASMTSLGTVEVQLT